MGLPAVRAACLLGFIAARVLTLSSESEFGCSIRCRLAGFGRADWRVVVAPLVSQGSVLVMTIDAQEWWREKRLEGERGFVIDKEIRDFKREVGGR